MKNTTNNLFYDRKDSVSICARGSCEPFMTLFLRSLYLRSPL